MKQVVWMKVSNDKYELPECICDSAKELAEHCKVKEDSIHESRSRAKHRGGKSHYVMVEID